MVINEANVALNTFNTMRTLVSSLITLRDGEMIRSKVYEITEQLMGLQAQMMEAQSINHTQQLRIRELEQELESLKARIDERSRYQLHRFDTGCFAYGLKSEFRDTDVEHYLCSTCFDQGIRVVLQPYETVLAAGFICPRCKTKAVVRNKPQEPSQPTSYNW